MTISDVMAAISGEAERYNPLVEFLYRTIWEQARWSTWWKIRHRFKISAPFKMIKFSWDNKNAGKKTPEIEANLKRANEIFPKHIKLPS